MKRDAAELATLHDFEYGAVFRRLIAGRQRRARLDRYSYASSTHNGLYVRTMLNLDDRLIREAGRLTGLRAKRMHAR